MDEEIMKAALDLGKLIGMSEQYITLKECEELAMHDEEGLQLLNDLRILQREYLNAKKDKLGEDVLESLVHLIEMKKEEIQEYRPTGMFFKAKDEFDAFMKEVNNKILEGITGEPQKDYKSGGCGGCKGCGK
jgi:cell fate (sporulation/competence/biofilm development) regulator YlbF (YheA/YmcA/DUF963 family)